VKLPPLNINDYHDVVDHYHGESDRAAIVMAGSFAESYLGTYIREFMVNRDDANDDIARMFESGPLSAWANRIRIAYAFGLIPPDIRDDLHHLKQIRNLFAHSPKPIQVGREDVQTHLKKLSTWKLVHSEEAPAETRDNDRMVYLFAVGMFVVFAIQTIKKKQVAAGLCPPATDKPAVGS
jgi:hypothetical protein